MRRSGAQERTSAIGVRQRRLLDAEPDENRIIAVEGANCALVLSHAILSQESNMDTNTLIIVIVVVLLLGGGGFFFRRR
jgi:LPXTG-motif cell wall-anchored protein